MTLSEQRIALDQRLVICGMRGRDAFTPDRVLNSRTLHIEVGIFNVEPSEYIAETQAIDQRQHVTVGDRVECTFLEPKRRVEAEDLDWLISIPSGPMAPS